MMVVISLTRLQVLWYTALGFIGLSVFGFCQPALGAKRKN